MKIDIEVRGDFEYLKNGADKTAVSIDLVEMLENGNTIEQLIEEELEEMNRRGCRCTFDESRNNCDCDCYGYNYSYVILGVEKGEQ